MCKSLLSNNPLHIEPIHRLITTFADCSSPCTKYTISEMFFLFADYLSLCNTEDTSSETVRGRQKQTAHLTHFFGGTRQS